MHSAGINTRRVLGYRCHQVLAYVRSEVETTGVAPSYSQIRDTVGLCNKGNVARVVAILERRGLLRRTGTGRVRRIRLS